jgi:hypothetical protein
MKSTAKFAVGAPQRRARALLEATEKQAQNQLRCF